MLERLKAAKGDLEKWALLEQLSKDPSLNNDTKQGIMDALYKLREANIQQELVDTNLGTLAEMPDNVITREVERNRIQFMGDVNIHLNNMIRFT